MRRQGYLMGFLAAASLSIGGCSSDGDTGLGGGGTAGSAGSSGSGGSGSGGEAGSASGGAAGHSGAAGSAGHCESKPVQRKGDERVCEYGYCRCEASDVCFAKEDAARCCAGKFRCFSSDGSPTCEGRPPKLTDGKRTCDAGYCYCSAGDVCFPSETATPCCGVQPACAD
jgi:hypothetical protein